ncbi:UrcA family protein [Nostoc sp. 3335mG]|nr:UrcA family protein [Nostoc sp. 3335mG]
MAIRFASLALAAALVSAPAFAAPAADGMSATVRFGDLDLSTDAGAAALHSRIAYAARAVCGGDADQHDLNRLAAMESCRQVAMASAAPQMQLALANARNGRQLAANDVKITAHGF